MSANLVVISSSALPQVQSVNGQTGVISLQLSGDATSPAGSLVTTLATVNSSVGSFGDASHTVTVTLDGKGRATAAAANAIAIAASQVTSGTFAAGLMPAFSGDISTTAGATATTLATVNANTGSFGSSTQIPSFTVNAKGLITAASANTLSLVSPPPIGSATANSGAFTTLSATGNFTPSQTNGIVGTTTNNNVNAGSVGEYVSATWTSTSLTNGTIINATSISLTAGDWDVGGGFAIVASGSNITNGAAGVSSTSATFGAAGSYAQQQSPAYTAYAGQFPITRFSLASTTTIYAVIEGVFATGTCTTSGTLRARRVR